MQICSELKQKMRSIVGRYEGKKSKLGAKQAKEIDEILRLLSTANSAVHLRSSMLTYLRTMSGFKLFGYDTNRLRVALLIILDCRRYSMMQLMVFENVEMQRIIQELSQHRSEQGVVTIADHQQLRESLSTVSSRLETQERRVERLHAENNALMRELGLLERKYQKILREKGDLEESLQELKSKYLRTRKLLNEVQLELENHQGKDSSIRNDFLPA